MAAAIRRAVREINARFYISRGNQQASIPLELIR